MSERVATIWIADGAIKLRMPYYDECAVADLKGTFCSSWRRYDRKTNVWSILVTQLERVQAFARRHFRVVYLGDLPSIQRDTTHLSELAELLGDLPGDVLHKLYQALIFELHPDRGGDPELAQRLNDIWRAMEN